MTKSFNFRTSQLFLRNEYQSNNPYGFSVVKKQKLDLSNLQGISASNIKRNDSQENRQKCVLTCVDDWRLEKFYLHPDLYLDLLSQYRILCTPDYSLYGEMNRWRQIENVGKNRWCGAYWQEHGFNVVTTISWAFAPSYDFCFDGVEKGSIVAIGMIGCKSQSRINFMSGYNEMVQRIEPSAIICFGKPFPEMQGNLIVIDYLSTFNKGGQNGR